MFTWVYKLENWTLSFSLLSPSHTNVITHYTRMILLKSHFLTTATSCNITSIPLVLVMSPLTYIIVIVLILVTDFFLFFSNAGLSNTNDLIAMNLTQYSYFIALVIRLFQ